MKSLVALFSVLMLLLSCGRNNSEISDNALYLDQSDQEGQIEFRNLRYDFGTVSHGEKLVYSFIYKNTGDVPLVVYSAVADCGCTVPEYSNKPLAPGMEGNLKAVFDTRGFSGYQTKTIRVNTNAGVHTLNLRAVIE